MKTQGIQAKIIAWVLSVGAGLSFCCNHIEIPNKIGRIPNEMIAKIEPGVVGFAQGSSPNRFKIVDGSGAPDPSTILNLFGLLPWANPTTPGSILAIISLGILPILLGISMWLQQKLNPAPTDKTQAMIFAWMPWVFMFMLGTFASGLVIYWIANNMITFIQQYLIMRRQGYKPDVFGNILASFKKKKGAE